MNKRKLIVGGLGLILFAGAIFLRNYLSEMESPPPKNGYNEAAVVRTMEVINDTQQVMLEVTGRIQASEKVDLFAEVSGKATYGNRAFKSGTFFRKGEILINIDDSEFKSSLISSKSQFLASIATVLPDIKLDFSDSYGDWEAYLKSYDIHKTTPALPKVDNDQLKLFLSGRGIYTSYFKIREAETRLDKFIIRAPYDGYLTEAFVNQGTLVRIGQQLGEFIKDSDFELEGSVNNSLISSLEIGMETEFELVGGNASFKGKLVRINQKVDPGTQLVKVYFSMFDKNLKPGMYLRTSVPVKKFSNAVELPLESIVEDAFVFTVSDSVARLSKVNILNKNTEKVIVSGLKNKDKVIIDRKNSAFEGSKVIEL